VSGIPDNQALFSVCNYERYDCEQQDGRHVLIFGAEAYKIITTLENASLQLGHEFSIFTAPYSCQLSNVAILEVPKIIQKLWEMVEELEKLFRNIDESKKDQETKEANEHIYTSISEIYPSHI
jgi:hypothetical protein